MLFISFLQGELPSFYDVPTRAHLHHKKAIWNHLFEQSSGTYHSEITNSSVFKLVIQLAQTY